MGFITSQKGLPFQVQTIAREIDTAPISPKKYKVLSNRLDTTFKALLAQKNDNPFLESLQGRCVDLYQKLEDGSVEWEISQIQKEALDLKKGAPSPRAIQQLESHIQALLKNHAPSQEQNKILFDAKCALSQAKGGPIPSHFEFISQQQNIRSLDMLELIPGEIEDLFDIARAVHNGNLKKAKIHFQTLPQKHKSRFEGHMRFLGAEAFINPLETCQALIATANDLANNTDLYPTERQLDVLFAGVSELNDTGESKIALFS